MSLISARELSFEFGGQRVLNELNCSIEHNSRIGLIGANGCGKTTLIRLFLAELQPSAGVINRASSLKIAYLPQNAKVQPGIALIDFVKASRPDILALQAQIQSLSAQLDRDHQSKTEEQLHAVVERFTSLGGYEWENEVKHVLMSLNFQPEVWNTDVGLLSGGEQTRLCLAAILLKPHNLLIMDEPTNHLDIAMIRWLESYLLKQDKPYLLVSHDRSFLDACVTSIFHIRDGRLSITKGNYSSFAQADEIARQSAQKAYERQKKEYDETMDFVRRNIAGQKTKQAQSRLKRLEKMDLQPAPQQEKQLRLRIQTQSRSGNDLYVLQDVNFGIAGKQLAQKIDLYAGYQDRICIIGPNGCGKTTFLHLLMGEHTDYQGQLKIGASLEIGYFDQHNVDLDPSLTVMETLWQLVPAEPQGYVLSFLARFGFTGDEVQKTVGVLSGGEKSRLYLAVLIHSKPNLLIMDEPTNHLDTQVADALLEALQNYDGSIIFVSHDRWFLSRLATKYWVFTKELEEGVIYDTIREVEGDANAAIERSFYVPEVEKTPKSKPTQKVKRINPLVLERKQAEIDALQAQKEALQDQLLALQIRLSDSQSYSDLQLVKQLHQEQKNLEMGIEELSQRIDSSEYEYLELLCEEA